MSRLRRPTSASTSATLAPACASAVPMLAVVVVLPTPPFPEVMTIARPRGRFTAPSLGAGSSWSSCISTGLSLAEKATENPRHAQRGERDVLAVEPPRDLLVNFAQPRIGDENDGFFVVGDQAQELDVEDVDDVLDRHHIARAHHLGPDAIDDQPDRHIALVEFALSLIHISEPTRRTPISYAVFCL